MLEEQRSAYQQGDPRVCETIMTGVTQTTSFRCGDIKAMVLALMGEWPIWRSSQRDAGDLVEALMSFLKCGVGERAAFGQSFP
jgi:hypothetical protein